MSQFRSGKKNYGTDPVYSSDSDEYYTSDGEEEWDQGYEASGARMAAPTPGRDAYIDERELGVDIFDENNQKEKTFSVPFRVCPRVQKDTPIEIELSRETLEGIFRDERLKHWNPQTQCLEYPELDKNVLISLMVLGYNNPTPTIIALRSTIPELNQHTIVGDDEPSLMELVPEHKSDIPRQVYQIPQTFDSRTLAKYGNFDLKKEMKRIKAKDTSSSLVPIDHPFMKILTEPENQQQFGYYNPSDPKNYHDEVHRKVPTESVFKISEALSSTINSNNTKARLGDFGCRLERVGKHGFHKREGSHYDAEHLKDMHELGQDRNYHGHVTFKAVFSPIRYKNPNED